MYTQTHRLLTIFFCVHHNTTTLLGQRDISQLKSTSLECIHIRCVVYIKTLAYFVCACVDARLCWCKEEGDETKYTMRSDFIYSCFLFAFVFPTKYTFFFFQLLYSAMCIVNTAQPTLYYRRYTKQIRAMLIAKRCICSIICPLLALF